MLGLHLWCRWGRPIGFISLVWLVFAAVIFTLPQKYPLTGANFNFASVAVGGACVVIIAAWVLSAQFWFTGPRLDVDNSDAVRTKYWITDPPKKGLEGDCIVGTAHWPFVPNHNGHHGCQVYDMIKSRHWQTTSMAEWLLPLAHEVGRDLHTLERVAMYPLQLGIAHKKICVANFWLWPRHLYSRTKLCCSFDGKQ